MLVRTGDLFGDPESSSLSITNRVNEWGRPVERGAILWHRQPWHSDWCRQDEVARVQRQRGALGLFQAIVEIRWYLYRNYWISGSVEGNVTQVLKNSDESLPGS